MVRLGERFGLRNIRVFGSVARGEATADSDLDLPADVDRASLSGIGPVIAALVIGDAEDGARCMRHTRRSVDERTA